MLTKATLLAILAALASATPISPRTYPTIPSINSSTLPTTSLITATAGWSTTVAAGMEACSVGVASGCVDSATKSALASWVLGAGAAFFDVVTCKEITTWCTSSSDIILSESFQIVMEGALIAETAISAAGGVLSFLNGVIEAEYDSVPCLCSVIGAGMFPHDRSCINLQLIVKAERAALSAYLHATAITGALESTISGALTMCAAGGIAETLSIATIEALSAWISSSDCTLSADLKGPVLAWISAGSSGLTVGGSIGSTTGNVILGSSSQGALISFIGGSAFSGLSIEIQGAMHACASGGVAGVLSGAMQASFSAWLSAPSCPLDADLKVSMQAWLTGSMGARTQAGTSAGAYGYISMGSTISGYFNASGVMTAAAQASLSSFCGSSAGLALEGGILSSLESCAAGKLVSSIEATAASALAEFLSSSSCSLDVEMRGAVIMWLSFGITGVSGAAKGVGAGCGAGISISPELTAAFTAAISAGLNMSSTCKGALGVAIAGEAAWAVSTAGRAELVAYLISAEVTGLVAEVESALFGWITGTECLCSVVKSVPVTGGYPVSSGSLANSTTSSTSESSQASSGSSATLTDSSTQSKSSATESSSSESSKSLSGSSTTSSGTESSSDSSSSSESTSTSSGEETSDDDECDA